MISDHWQHRAARGSIPSPSSLRADLSDRLHHRTIGDISHILTRSFINPGYLDTRQMAFSWEFSKTFGIAVIREDMEV